MSGARFTYQHLVELVGGDRELITKLIEEGEIAAHEGDELAVVDLDRVLLARTLVRDLEVDWSGVEVILRLLAQLAEARSRIAELEAKHRR